MGVALLEKFEIIGGKRLDGTVRNQGSKNAGLPIFVASLLTDEEVVLRGVPDVIDLKNMAIVLRETGAAVHEGEVTRFEAGGISNPYISLEAAQRIRSSILLPAALVSRFSKATIPFPGGDSIGTRKLDSYVLGLRALGATVKTDSKSIYVEVQRAKGAKIELPFPSVTGTEGLLIAAVLADGKTVITNAAKEPEIVDLANFLISMGAKIKGAGTEVIKVTGVKELNGTDYTLIPDRMVAGTLLAAGAITGGSVSVENVISNHLRATLSKLKEIGVKVCESDSVVGIECGSRRVSAVDIVTEVYPGFPTDMQPIFMALLTIADGVSLIEETIYDDRFRHVEDLARMGARIEIQANTARIQGVKALRGTRVYARDIRAGAAITLSGLAAQGATEVLNVCEIDRGYAGLEKVLSSLGAEVKRVNG
jgi:UDP-N-acetylglucosamine 1-carboxyvinyltransferase